jgi:hypothetical protein
MPYLLSEKREIQKLINPVFIQYYDKYDFVKKLSSQNTYADGVTRGDKYLLGVVVILTKVA